MTYSWYIGVAGDLKLTDLIAGLGDSKIKLGASRKTLEKLERKAAPVSAPLPGPIRQRQERKAGCVAVFVKCGALELGHFLEYGKAVHLIDYRSRRSDLCSNAEAVRLLMHITHQILPSCISFYFHFIPSSRQV